MNQKTALITGASRGIGKAIALELAAAGYHLMLTCHKNKDLLEEVKNHITLKYPVTCLTHPCDIGDPNEVIQMYQKYNDHFQNLSVIINNAGISHVGLFTDMEPTQWQTILDTNLSSVFYVCRYGVPLMLQKKTGKIINISSVWGISGASCEVAYSATKGGVNTFTKALAKELAPSNIQVNAIACGAIETDMNDWLSDKELHGLVEDIPAGRLGKTAEVAALVLSLVSGNDYLTGQVIPFDGGWI